MIQLHKHEDNTHRRKSLTNIKLEVTPKCSLYKKGCVTEAQRPNKIQIKQLLVRMLQQGDGRVGKLNCCGRRCLHDGVGERKELKLKNDE